LEVNGVHPLNESDTSTPDLGVTIAKETGSGGYRVCITSSHDPLHIGSWAAGVAWSDHFISPEISLRGYGKMDCTDWRPHPITFIFVVYVFGGSRYWFSAVN
jgi:hypothetical protein